MGMMVILFPSILRFSHDEVITQVVVVYGYYKAAITSRIFDVFAVGDDVK